MSAGKIPRKLHSMGEFGTVFGNSQCVRVNRLETRLRPLVPFPHRHAFYHLVAIVSGGGWHEIDFHRYEVGPGRVYFMKPGQVHSWQLDERTQGFVIEFESSSLPKKGTDALLITRALNGASEQYDLRGGTCPSAHPNLTLPILALMEWMAQEYDRQASGVDVALRHCLIPLLIEISRLGAQASQTTVEPKPVMDSILDRFMDLVEQRFYKEHEVGFYAREMSTTSKALTMRTSRAFGKSARALIQERLMLEAKRLLAYSGLSVAEVGYELGFEDPNYFARFFRTHAGIAPGAFRIKARSL